MSLRHSTGSESNHQKTALIEKEVPLHSGGPCRTCLILLVRAPSGAVTYVPFTASTKSYINIGLTQVKGNSTQLTGLDLCKYQSHKREVVMDQEN